jgi:hypothetical protein
MGFLENINGLLADPAPDFSFEVPEAGLAWPPSKGKGFKGLTPSAQERVRAGVTTLREINKVTFIE